MSQICPQLGTEVAVFVVIAVVAENLLDGPDEPESGAGRCVLTPWCGHTCEDRPGAFRKTTRHGVSGVVCLSSLPFPFSR
ncbi:hypothetical protein AV530_019031 [Patagioenas fasciata monilis]|uniref:Uncharacterized protein n=1 Tax=Patagioenas fasciata monilis TaxID=372326 RepID=A0A1V4KX78_PATFA|nr:hypothetical protein AV530_019031 [Patagioenas fasciata monilis]